MKALSIIFGILLALTTIVILGLVSGLEGIRIELADSETQIQALNNEITSLTNENIELYAKAHLKSFENTKALERFLNNSEIILNADPDGYNSEYCIALMSEARDNGYWMGITAVNSTNESIYDALTRRLYGATNIHWYIYNVVVVGDEDIYLVNPMKAPDYHKLSTIVGDFAEYNKDTKSNVSNLNIH